LIFVGVRFSALRAENRTQMIEEYLAPQAEWASNAVTA
jgi:hypothetical protein